MWPVCSLLFGRVSPCEARGGSASNSRNKRTTERGIKLVHLLFQRTSRRKSAKYCILTVVSFVDAFKAIFDMDSFVCRSCLLDSHARVKVDPTIVPYYPLMILDLS